MSEASGNSAWGRRSICCRRRFIPGAQGAFAQVDTIGEHGEGGGCEFQLAGGWIGALRPAESALLQALGQNPQAGAIPVKNLKARASLVGKDKERAGAPVRPQLLGDQRSPGACRREPGRP